MAEGMELVLDAGGGMGMVPSVGLAVLRVQVPRQGVAVGPAHPNAALEPLPGSCWQALMFLVPGMLPCPWDASLPLGCFPRTFPCPWDVLL